MESPADASQSQGGLTTDRESGSEGPPSAGRLLVVEGGPGVVDFPRRGGEGEGVSVETATDGTEGERLALKGEYDAVVLDLMLPGLSGLEILASVMRSMPGLPVIVLTARGEIEDRVAGLEAGGVAT